MPYLIPCIFCKGIGRIEQDIGPSDTKRGQRIKLPCLCPHCKGKTQVPTPWPTVSWQTKSKEAQELAHVALLAAVGKKKGKR